GAKKHGQPDQHAHRPNESPKSMWVPLVVLAIFATIGGFVGISTAFTGGREVGGKLNIVNWMEPIIWNKELGTFGNELPPNTTPLLGRDGPFGANTPPAEAERLQRGLHPITGEESDRAGFNLAHTVKSKVGSETATEWIFIIISLIVAGIGMAL